VATTSIAASLDLTSAADSSVARPIRRRGWSAVDSVAEAQLEARFQRKVTWREALFGWLIEFNRY
jgi:hypothetical protein